MTIKRGNHAHKNYKRMKKYHAEVLNHSILDTQRPLINRYYIWCISNTCQ